MRKCNWCGENGALANGKPYCDVCKSRCYRECCRCKRPFEKARFFLLDPNGIRCNSCQHKYLKEKDMASSSSRLGKLTMCLSDSEGFTLSEAESAAGEIKSPEKAKAAKKPHIKRTVSSVKPRQTSRKGKKANDAMAEALKNLLCQWSQEEDCIKKILEGKKIAFVPVFI